MGNFKNIPHLVQYQGSKRNLAKNIIQFFPEKFDRLVEPFAGSAAISIACAFYEHTNNFLINDLNGPLSKLLQLVVKRPDYVADRYERLWEQQVSDPINFYNEIREKFNISQNPVLFLYLLARCVKGSVRYNGNGEFNQSPDKRRLGTNPNTMRKNIFSISSLLRNKNCTFMSMDYRDIIKIAQKGDILYMDPPYQGVCGNKDSRYYSGIDFENFVCDLERLNEKEIDYIISYDGECGSKKYGEKLPKHLALKHIKIPAGRSTQATLLGRNDETIESLYVTKTLYENIKQVKHKKNFAQLKLNGFSNEEKIF